MNPDDLVVVRTFLNVVDAELAKSALGSAQVESLIQADDAGGMRPHLWMHGVRLLVRLEDAGKAADILGSGDGN